MDYPKPSDPEYCQFINDTFSQFKIPPEKKTFNEICFPVNYELQIPQKFLAAYMNPSTPYRNLLIYHKIGGGKTCAAISIAEQFKGHSKIIVVMPASLRGNFRSELRSLCAGESYLTNSERERLAVLNPTDAEYMEIIDRSNVRINRWYTVYSYNKFISTVKTVGINLSDTLLIIDEIQNMVSESGVYYDMLTRLFENAPVTLRKVLMTATPIFDKPMEFALTINLLIPEKMATGKEFINEYIDIKRTRGEINYQLKNISEFKRLIYGYVSYYSGAPEYVFPKTIVTVVRCQMSYEQLTQYKIVSKRENKKLESEYPSQFDFISEGISDSFYIGTRMISNFAYPYESPENFTDSQFQLGNLSILSDKYVEIINRIKKAKGCVFIYSNFKGYGGIGSLIRALKSNGFFDYKEYGPGPNRFAIWSGDENMNYRDKIKTIFNDKSNINGDFVKIILGTTAIKEGVTLLRIDQIHIVEPYWNMSRLEQVMGRGIRFCSHRDVPLEKQRVHVFMYIAHHPEIKLSVDQRIMDMAIRKKIINVRFEKAIKEAALDCQLFYNANSTPENPLKCDQCLKN
jgi:hypothetical protein